MSTDAAPDTPPSSPGASELPTREYEVLQSAFDHFNRELFESKLPSVLLTLPRAQDSGGGYKGYFSPDRIGSRTEERLVHEIALNPAQFREVSDEDILSTLVHEMVHLWQQKFGRPSPGHNQEWAEKMTAVGLLPTHTGRPGGRPTGRSVTHCIIEGGLFQQSARRFLKGTALGWQHPVWSGSPHSVATPGAAGRKRNMIFECPRCGLKAETLAAAGLWCKSCQLPMEGVHAKEGIEPWPFLFISAAVARSDHETARRLFGHCVTILVHAPAWIYSIADTVATGLTDREGPGWALREFAAGWIVNFLRDKTSSARARALKDLLGGEDIEAVLQVILPQCLPDEGDEHRSALMKWMKEHGDKRIRLAAESLPSAARKSHPM